MSTNASPVKPQPRAAFAAEQSEDVKRRTRFIVKINKKEKRIFNQLAAENHMPLAIYVRGLLYREYQNGRGKKTKAA